MAFDVWAAFVMVSIVALVVPGPVVLSVTSYAMAYGRRASGALIAGVALGDSTALFVSLLAVEMLRASSAFWFDVVRVSGGVYVIYLGSRLLRDRTVIGAVGVETVSRWKLFARMYGVTALNPKGMIFYLAVLPQFVNPAAGVWKQLVVLSTTFVTLATANAILYSAGAASLRGYMFSASRQRRFNVAAGVLLVCAGLWILFLP